MKKIDTIVMIPTYNEAGNIEKILSQVLAVDPRIGCLIVDDNSPDGTGKIVDRLAKKYQGRIFPIHRYHEKGRASAGIRGFKEILKLKPRFIAEMDADFSHQPKYLKNFLKEIKNCDVVLGSRVVKGGQDIDRGFIRKGLTFLSGQFLRLLLGIKIKDSGSGFKLYRSEVIRSLDLKNFFAKKGIAISLEINFRIIKKGYKIKEFPIIFHDRKLGRSKLNWQDFIEPIIVALRLFFKFGRSNKNEVFN